jgi:MoxR-like ATPase
MTMQQQSPSIQADPAAVEAFKERFDAVHANVSRAIMGKPGEIQLALTCMLAEGHLLVDDVPGTGKTTLAKAIAASLGSAYHRIQFTPDLLPTDVTGSMIYNAKDGDFTFHPGGVFANVVLADEINRASPKTQSALLEVMEERQVTVDSVTRPVPRPFVVIATQNPVEFDGTYHLPEAQIDRFMMRMAMGYPSHQAEVESIMSRLQGHRPEDLTAAITAETFEWMIDTASTVAQYCRNAACVSVLGIVIWITPSKSPSRSPPSSCPGPIRSSPNPAGMVLWQTNTQDSCAQTAW